MQTGFDILDNDVYKSSYKGEEALEVEYTKITNRKQPLDHLIHHWKKFCNGLHLVVVFCQPDTWLCLLKVSLLYIYLYNIYCAINP